MSRSAPISTSLPFVGEWCFMVWIYHILPIHSLAGGHVGCSNLSPVRITLLRTLAYKLLCSLTLSFLLVRHRGVNCWVIWSLYASPFEELPECFPKWLHYFPTPLAEHEGLNSFTFLPTLVIIFLSMIILLWTDISSWFWLASPWRLMMLSIFSRAHWPFVCLPWRHVYSDPLPIS